MTVIGHPLAAEENRLAFAGWTTLHVDLILPKIWKARSLGHVYRAPAVPRDGQPAMHALSTIATGRNSLFLWVGLGRLLRSLKPDVIYCWEEPWCLSTWQVGRVAHELGIPLIFYSAENRPKRLPWPFRIVLRSVFATARACIAPTEEISERIRAWGFAGRIFTIPLWVRLRRPLKADASGRCLAFVGRLIPLKRVDLLIESLAHLPGYELRIIGDGPERTRLTDLAKGLGLASRVHFRGHIDNGSLEAGLEGASLVVVPTAENLRQAEQFGKAALEGVTCGLPVLASRTGNLAALAGEFPTLSVLDLDTPAQLAQAVSAVFRDYPGEAALAGSRRQAEDSYGPSAAARRLEAAFSELAAGGRT
ncbi:MAG: glycosyltransferase [Fibrobacterota bacterium]|nr:glycosyltransferase [Fibrobacterota bacterium]